MWSAEHAYKPWYRVDSVEDANAHEDRGVRQGGRERPARRGATDRLCADEASRGLCREKPRQLQLTRKAVYRTARVEIHDQRTRLPLHVVKKENIGVIEGNSFGRRSVLFADGACIGCEAAHQRLSARSEIRTEHQHKAVAGHSIGPRLREQQILNRGHILWYDV
eukprot:6213681-Pleurochrysis_carterae.AAC.2